MMKTSNAKILSSIAMMLILSVSLGFAEDNSTVFDNSTSTFDNSTDNNITEEDVKVLDIPEGVSLRFLQLERQLTLTIERGDRVVAELQSLGVSDVSEFNLLLDQLEIIRDEAASYTNPANIPDVSNAAVLFVDLKKESISLIAEFRNLVHTLHENKIQRLKNAADSVNETGNYTVRIRNMIRSYNANKVKNALQNMGVDNETLVNEIGNGTLIKNQIKNRIKNTFESLNDSEGLKALVRIQQRITQNEVLISSINQTVRVNSAIRQNERLQERIEKIEEKVSSLRSSINSLRDKVNQGRGSNVTGNIVKMNNGKSDSKSNNGRGSEE
ncbi:MAG: hypothetical protein JW791_00430 [Nanoarchaeota archaeon]|nr:hypothetical protein [Nanoarchaeota archaeon]